MPDLLPADLSTGALAILAASAFIAAMARGFSGFGAALIFVPLATTVVSPQIAAPLLLITDGVLAAGFIPNAWRNADKREVGIMALGGIVGAPLGALVLIRSDPVSIRWIVVVTSAAMLALLMSGWRYRGEPTAPVTFGFGALAGLCSGAAQVGGPPVVAYWLGRTTPAVIVRASIILFFVSSTVVSTLSYFAGGLLTRAVFGLALVVGPVYGLGLFIGSRLFGVADESIFRRICYALIAAAVLFSSPALDGVIR